MTPVALVQIPSALPGYRGYLAVTKSGRIVKGLQVSDSGQGAANAVRLVQAEFTISQAKWVPEVAREARRRLATERPDLDWTGYRL